MDKNCGLVGVIPARPTAYKCIIKTTKVNYLHISPALAAGLFL